MEVLPISIRTERRNAQPQDQITIWTSLTPKERERGVRWFASRSMSEQAEIIANSVEVIFPRLQKANPDAPHNDYVHYAAFILAIRRAGFDLLRKRGCRVHGHKEFQKFEALRQATLSSLRNGKKAPLRQEVLALWGEVRTLKNQGTGFQLIARYLLRAHKVKVSASYLAKLWKELES